MKLYTMITRHGNKAMTSAYTLISSDYQTVTVSAAELAKQISAKKIEVTNLTVGKNGIESTNGALNKYTLINSETNQIEGIPSAVILDRVEQDGKLVGYTVFTQNGMITEISITDAVALANNKILSNGKIRHTEQGDIVSSIGGNYPLRTIEISKAPKGDVTVDILYFAAVQGVATKYVGAIVSGTSATEMSKITKIVSDSNAKVVAETVKVAGQSARKSLAIQRMGANSIYAIFGIDVLKKLVGNSNTKLANGVGSIIVSAGKYVDGQLEETKVSIDKKWNISGGTDGAAGKYAAALVKEFGGNEIK